MTVDVTLTQAARSRTGTETGTGGATATGTHSATDSGADSAIAKKPAKGPVTPRGGGDAVRRAELAAFLRSRRERITPEHVGLPRGSRRRTPGLRREEVAHLAAVGVTWYTWLEQARDIHVSPQVLDAVARALLLDKAERRHLFALAGAIDPLPGTECTGVPRALRQIMDQVAPFPAVVQNSRFDILAYNSTYGQLMCDLDALPEEDRNCMWLAFTHPEWRAAMGDLDASVCMMAAKFRASMAEHVAEPAWKALVARLSEASPEFRAIWARHEVVRPVSSTKIFQNSKVGAMELAATSLWTGPNPGPTLVTYTPVDETSRKRLELLQELATARA
ncbi:helix-turn-helix domain-containing protein [Streptomyces piniterrae]|uniref:Helix-turn-helix domain-containing protein n=1 Tax=Streptomyces piniterrae TaxID=2571125 RepID=A0A4U0NMW7_9ACTN|nr:helix-turn-helix transcriptional regulator [Streptomyces piniterrae]TJZ55735.1 helix-turn-helix domain-containing protein [Streptomyces piniterrae]